MSFEERFRRATGNDPFPYQRRVSTEREIPELVDVPTGLGKTGMAVYKWRKSITHV
jgi:CRISPR-associated endonuclease/helicase Cas3